MAYPEIAFALKATRWLPVGLDVLRNDISFTIYIVQHMFVGLPGSYKLNSFCHVIFILGGLLGSYNLIPSQTMVIERPLIHVYSTSCSMGIVTICYDSQSSITSTV